MIKYHPFSLKQLNMFTVTIKSRFSSAHQLRGYDGMCERMHGHNWTVDATVSGDQLNEIGILVDFIVLQKVVDDQLKPLDHINLNEHPWFLEENATSENLAKHVYHDLQKALEKYPVTLKDITVWETEDYKATYTE